MTAGPGGGNRTRNAALLLAILLAAACHETVAPKDCTIITNRGLHADTATIHCTK